MKAPSEGHQCSCLTGRKVYSPVNGSVQTLLLSSPLSRSGLYLLTGGLFAPDSLHLQNSFPSPKCNGLFAQLHIAEWFTRTTQGRGTVSLLVGSVYGWMKVIVINWTHACRLSELSSVSMFSTMWWFPWSGGSGGSGPRWGLCPRCCTRSAVAAPRPLHLGTGSSWRSYTASTGTSCREGNGEPASPVRSRNFGGVKRGESSGSRFSGEVWRHSGEARYGGSVSSSSGEAEEKKSRGRWEDGDPRGRHTDGDGDSERCALSPPSLSSPSMSDMARVRQQHTLGLTRR